MNTTGPEHFERDATLHVRNPLRETRGYSGDDSMTFRHSEIVENLLLSDPSLAEQYARRHGVNCDVDDLILTGVRHDGAKTFARRSDVRRDSERGVRAGEIARDRCLAEKCYDDSVKFQRYYEEALRQETR